MKFEIFLLFPNFLSPNSSVTLQWGYTTFIINNQTSFHLWWKKDLVKHQKVSIYYHHDCLQNFILLFMSILTAPVVEKSFFGWNLLYLSKKGPRPNLKSFQYRIWTSGKISKTQLSCKTNFSTFLQISCLNFSLKLC